LSPPPPVLGSAGRGRGSDEGGGEGRNDRQQGSRGRVMDEKANLGSRRSRGDGVGRRGGGSGQGSAIRSRRALFAVCGVHLRSGVPEYGRRRSRLSLADAGIVVGADGEAESRSRRRVVHGRRGGGAMEQRHFTRAKAASRMQNVNVRSRPGSGGALRAAGASARCNLH